MTFWRPIAGNLDSSWHVPCTEAFVAQLFAFSSLAKLLYPWRLRTLCCLQLQTIDAAWSAIPAGFANFWTRRIELGWTPLLQIALAISWLVLPKVSSCLPWSLLKTKDKRNNWVVPSSRELRHEMFTLVQRLGRLTVSSWGSGLPSRKLKTERLSIPACKIFEKSWRRRMKIEKSKDTTESALKTLECWWNSITTFFFGGQ